VRFYWTVTLLFSLSNCLLAQYSRIYRPFLEPKFKEHQTLTHHPKDDFDPAISPDGNWLVFTSNRLGNRDLWIKSVNGGQTFQITMHKADDHSPCWAPNGKVVYFISTRSDALGDLWQAEFNPKKLPGAKIELSQIDTYLGYDDEPSCSPDGRWIAITSTRLSANHNIWIIEPATKNVFPFTLSGGVSPDWSLDGKWIAYSKIVSSENKTESEIFVKKFDPLEPFSGFGLAGDYTIQVTQSQFFNTFPVWSKSDLSLYFLRHELDTNNDNKIDVEDNPSVLHLNLNSNVLDSLDTIIRKDLGIEFPPIPTGHLTSANKYILLPTVTKENLFFATRKKIQFDIVKIPIGGEIPTLENAKRQFFWTDSTYSLQFLRQLQLDQDSLFMANFDKKSSEFYTQRLFAFQNFYECFPNDYPWNVKAGLEIGRELEKKGETVAAIQLNRKLLYKTRPGDSLFVEINLAILKNQQIHQDSIDNILNVLFDSSKIDLVSQAKILLFKAELSKSNEKPDEALNYLQQIVYLGSKVGENYHSAINLQAEIFQQTNEFSKAIDSYLQIVKTTNSKFWNQVACTNIAKILSINQTENNQTVKIIEAIQKYHSNPALCAELNVALGKYFIKKQNYQQATEILEFIFFKYPTQKLTLLKTGILLTSIFEDNKQYENAVEIYKRLLNRRDLTDLEQSFCQEKIWNLQLEIAEKLYKQKNFLQAFNLYQPFFQLDSKRPETFLGLVQSAEKLNRLLDLEKEFKIRLKKNPQDEICLYALGLINSKIHENNRKGLIKSNEYLEEALTINVQLVPAYLTLSKNYEQLEFFQKQELEKTRSWFVNTARQIFGPVIWFYRTVTLKKAAQVQNWYEQAIEKLNVALDINDENRNKKLEASIYHNLANIYYNMGEFSRPSAVQYYLKKTEYDSTFDSLSEQANYYQRLGHSAMSTKDWTLAESSLKKSLRIYEKSGNIQEVQQTQKLLAQSYQLAGKHQVSNEIYSRTLNHDKNSENNRALLETYRNIAYNHLVLRDEQDVRNYCLKALNILENEKLEKRALPSTSVRLEFLGFSIPMWSLGNLGPSIKRNLFGYSAEDEKALLHTLLAENENHRKNYFSAMQLMKDKLAVLRKEDDVLGQAVMINNIGMMHITLGNYHDAYRWFKISYDRCKKLDFLSGEITNLLNMSKLALIFSYYSTNEILCYKDLSVDPKNVINRIDLVLEKIEDYPFAFIYERVELFHQRALLSFIVLKTKIVKNTDSLSVFQIPSFLFLENEISVLIDEFELAAEMARRNSLIEQQAHILKDLGDLCVTVELLPESEDYYKKALSIANENDYLNLAWQILFSLGSIYIKNDTGSDLLGVDYFYKAKELFLKQRFFYPQNSLDAISGFDKELLYNNLITYLCQNGEIEEALYLSEENQSLDKLEHLHQVEIKLGDEDRNSNQKHYFELLSEINRLKKRINEIQKSRRGGYRLFYQVVDSLTILRSRLDYFIEELEQNDPELLALLRPLKFEVEHIQQLLKSNQSALVFFTSIDNVYSWCINSDSIYFYQHNILKGHLIEMIERFNYSIRNNAYSTTISDSLSGILFTPFKDQIGSKSELIIIAENSLANLPFELLNFEEDLVYSKFSVSYHPSITDFLLSFKQKQELENNITWIGTTNNEFAIKNDSLFSIKQLNSFETTEEQFKAIFDQTDYLVINRPLLFVQKPFMYSNFRFQIPTTTFQSSASYISDLPSENDGFYSLNDLFSQNNKSAILFSLYPQDSSFIENSLLSVVQTAWRNAGIPSYVTVRWPVSNEVKHDFISNYLSQINKIKPFEAFRFAQNRIRKKYPNLSDPGTFVWWGPHH